MDSGLRVLLNPSGGVTSGYRLTGRAAMIRAASVIASFFFFTMAFAQGVFAQGAPAMPETSRAQVREDMTNAASLLWSSIVGETSRVENLVRYSRQDLLSLSLNDEARRDWVYWPAAYVRRTAGHGTGTVDLNSQYFGLPQSRAHHATRTDSRFARG